MNAATHTPGPWRVEAGATMIWGACNPDDRTTYGMGYPIAYCRASPTDRWAKGPDEVEGIANAYLTAAGPDMLAALRKSADGWANALEFGLIPPQHRTAAEVMRDEAFAAIAKAEGRS